MTSVFPDMGNLKNSSMSAVALLTAGMLYIALVSSVASGATTTPTSDVEINTDKPSYNGNATIIVSGVVPEAKEYDVTVTITSPGGAVIATAGQTTDEDSGEFTVSFTAGGVTWGTAGNYTATVIFPGQTFITGSTTFAYTPLSVSSSQSSKSLTSSQSSSASPAATTLASQPTIVALAAAAGFIVLGLLALLVRSRRSSLPQTTHSAALDMGHRPEML